MSRTGYVYIHTSPSGMSYIGKSLASIGSRWKDHINAAYNDKYKEYNYPLQRAIRKYGEDSFTSDILEDGIPEQQLAELETIYIDKHDTFYNGYNQSKGGEGVTGERSVEARYNIAKANTERVWTEEMRNRMAESKAGINGSKFTPWWIRYPNGSYEEIHNKDKATFAIESEWAIGGFKNMFSKDKNVGKEVQRGRYKGYTFGNVGATYE